jgi:hypothetical protein
MSALPSKYVPVEYSSLGVAALLVERLAPNDTVSTLWDRCKADARVRTFDRFAAALSLLFAGGVVWLERGVISLRDQTAVGS